MSDRGEYRPFFGSILDDPEFQLMDGRTFKVLFTLKMSLGPAGIGVPRLLALAEIVGCSPDELAESLALLERPKPGEEYGWILRERNIIWLVNGLRHELLKPNNHPHKKRVENQIQSLGAKPIGALFRSYYHEWFDPKIPPREGVSREPKGSHEGVSRHKSESETKQDETRSENETGTIEGAGAFLDKFYTGASPERRAEVKSQLVASLSPEGARIRDNDFAKAKDRGHLARCLKRTIAERIRNPDRAIVVLLKKLQDEEKDDRGRYPGEIAVARGEEEIAREKAYERATRAAAKEWADQHPEQLSDLRSRAVRQFPGDGAFIDSARISWIVQDIAKRISFPDFETWTAGAAALV